MILSITHMKISVEVLIFLPMGIVLQTLLYVPWDCTPLCIVAEDATKRMAGEVGGCTLCTLMYHASCLCTLYTQVYVHRLAFIFMHQSEYGQAMPNVNIILNACSDLCTSVSIIL